MSLDPSRSPISRPVALVSDIHGRLDALDAVLDELRRREVGLLMAAGDHLAGGPEPLGVWRRLSETKARLARGLSDSALASLAAEKVVPTNDIERAAAERFFQTRSEVGDLVLAELRRLPLSLRVPLIDGSELLLVHGAPSDPFGELSQDLADEELYPLLDDDPADLIVCGKSHVPFQRVLEGVHVVNVGSVGEAPEGRVAHYSILTPHQGAVTVEQSWVEY